MRAKVPLALSVVLLAGCAGYQVVPTTVSLDQALSAPAPTVSKICIVRPQTRVLASTAVVRDNGQLVGATDGESYFCYAAQPGQHHIVAVADRQSGFVDAEPKPGETLYLRQTVTSGNETTISWGELSVDQARQEAAPLRYVTLGSAGHEALPDASAVAPALEQGGTQVASRPSQP